ncbi:hypothetical protein VNO77_15139 [Canavalia gladiata]|uniref:Uncharacterized protein n=1 Tax=Canavalia gladiata TaxID=3824 RepID=A0AAN9LZA4_CANGL
MKNVSSSGTTGAYKMNKKKRRIEIAERRIEIAERRRNSFPSLSSGSPEISNHEKSYSSAVSAHECYQAECKFHHRLSECFKYINSSYESSRTILLYNSTAGFANEMHPYLTHR